MIGHAQGYISLGKTMNPALSIMVLAAYGHIRRGVGSATTPTVSILTILDPNRRDFEWNALVNFMKQDYSGFMELILAGGPDNAVQEKLKDLPEDFRLHIIEPFREYIARSSAPSATAR